MGLFSRKSATDIRATLDEIDAAMLARSSELSDIDAKRRELAPLAFEGDGKARKDLAAVNERRRVVDGELEELRFAGETAQADYDAAAAREVKAQRKADRKRFDELLDQREANAGKVEQAAIALRDAIHTMQADNPEILALHKKFVALGPANSRFRPMSLDAGSVGIRITEFLYAIRLGEDLHLGPIALLKTCDLHVAEAAEHKILRAQVDYGLAAAAPVSAEAVTARAGDAAAIAGQGKANGSGKEADHDTAV